MADPEKQQQEEWASRYGKLSTALTVLGAAITAFTGRGRRWAAVLGGTLTLGGAAKRWAVFKAGFQSARDPGYAFKFQGQRLESRSPDGRRTETFGGDGRAR